ncbi:MAG: energy-coupling factor transporter transmembrane component T [archaeon]|nr:energy-coupling factor transporter transmembrane component T [archaeon]
MKLSFSQKNSSIHSMHSASILVWVCAVTIASLLFSNPLFLIALMLSVLLVIIASKSFTDWLGFLKFFIFMSLLIVLINSFASQYGSHYLFNLPISIESIVFGLTMALRLIVIVSAFAVFTFAANPDQLLNSLAKTKIPFKFLLVLLLSMRFMPLLSNEAKNIKEAQQVRGISLENDSFIEKTKKSFYFLLPMLFVSMEKSVSLSESMESRAFGSQERSFFNPNKFKQKDLLLIIECVIFVLFCIFLVISKSIIFDFYPVLSSLSISSNQIILLFLVFVLSSFIILFSLVKK